MLESPLPNPSTARFFAAQAALAREAGIEEVVITENGKMLRLAPGPVKVVDEVLTDVLLVDGRLLRTPEDANVRERRALSFAGFVSALVTLDERLEMDDTPQINLIGIPARDDTGEAFADALIAAVESAVEGIPRRRRSDPDLVAKAARRAIRSHMAQRWGKKPLCHVFVSALE